MNNQNKICKIYHTTLPLEIPEMDIEHEELMVLLNKISDLVFNKPNDNAIIELLSNTIECAAIHFSREELLIKQFLNKEEADAHIKQHSKALATLVELKTRMEIDLIKFQIKYKSDMANFVHQVFDQDYLLSLKMKEKPFIKPRKIKDDN